MIPEAIAIRLANSTEVTPETFLKYFLKMYQTQKIDDPMIEIKEMKTMPKSSKHVLIDILNSRLSKSIQAPTTMPSSGESIEESYGSSTQSTSTTIDIIANQDDDDTESDSDYESSGQKNWNDTNILLDEDSDRSIT